MVTKEDAVSALDAYLWGDGNVRDATAMVVTHLAQSGREAEASKILADVADPTRTHSTTFESGEEIIEVVRNYEQNVTPPHEPPPTDPTPPPEDDPVPGSRDPVMDPNWERHIMGGQPYRKDASESPVGGLNPLLIVGALVAAGAVAYVVMR